MVKHQNGGNRLLNSLLPLFDLVDERREADNRIVFEQKRGYCHVPRGRAEEVAKRRAGAIGATSLGRPPELPENRGRIEDVSTRPVGPLTINQSGTLQMVEVTERRAGRIQDVDARVSGPRRERLPFDPSAQQSGNVVELDRQLIKSAMRFAQRRDSRHHRTPCPQMPAKKWIPGDRCAFMLSQKRLQDGKVV
jgi:hypothetical protein